MSEPQSDNTAVPTDVYTHGHHRSVLASHTWRTVENSAAYLMPELLPGRSLLDVGCGPGTITREFAQRLAPGPVIGIDAAAGIVAQATAANDLEPLENLEYRLDDVYGLSFDDDQFDIVHAHQVLQHLSDPVAALVEMKRVAKPGGVVAVRDADYHAMSWYPRVDGLDRWMAVYQAVARHNKAEPDAGRRLVAWAREAGFGRIEATASTWCFATPEERRWWGGLWADRVERSSLAEQALDYGFATKAELAAIADDWRRWADHPDAWFAVVNGELLLSLG